MISLPGNILWYQLNLTNFGRRTIHQLSCFVRHPVSKKKEWWLNEFIFLLTLPRDQYRWVLATNHIFLNRNNFIIIIFFNGNILQIQNTDQWYFLQTVKYFSKIPKQSLLIIHYINQRLFQDTLNLQNSIFDSQQYVCLLKHAWNIIYIFRLIDQIQCTGVNQTDPSWNYNDTVLFNLRNILFLTVSEFTIKFEPFPRDAFFAFNSIFIIC